MNFFRLFSVVAVVFALSGCGDASDTLYALTVETKQGARQFKVELADSDAEIAKGLMDRRSLDDDKGMLFVFDDEKPRSFWMKNTLISLDMIFIRSDGKVTSIYRRAQPGDLTPIPSDGPSRAVLEIKGGMADILGISVGDRVVTDLLD